MNTGTSPGKNEYRDFPRKKKRLESTVDNPPPYRAVIKERVELHIYSQSGPSRLVLG
jgi:hypothetical protein